MRIRQPACLSRHFLLQQSILLGRLASLGLDYISTEECLLLSQFRSTFSPCVRYISVRKVVYSTVKSIFSMSTYYWAIMLAHHSIKPQSDSNVAERTVHP